MSHGRPRSKYLAQLQHYTIELIYYNDSGYYDTMFSNYGWEQLLLYDE